MPTHPLPTRPQVLETARLALDRDHLIQTETLATQDAAGRICAAPMRALCPSPTAHVSTRDGVAVASSLTRDASPDSPVELAPGTDCHPVNTGWTLPLGTDAVIPREEVRQDGNGTLLVSERVRPGRHVRPQGEDMEPGDLVLGPDALISPVDVGSLLTAGIFELPVYERVRMAFISTGDEILPFRSRPVPEPGQVIESNARMFCSLARTWGARAESLDPVADDPEALAQAVNRALDGGAHIVAVGAGSSHSNRDYTRTVFDAAGEILTPGVAMVPGRPGILATARGRLLAGVPGNPAGALAFMQEILGPLACWLGRRPLPPRSQAKAVMACDLAPRPGMERLVRIGLGLVDGVLLAAPLDRRSGLARTLARATGLLRVPADCPGLKGGDVVRVEWLTPHADPENHLVILGERCRALDILADELLEHGPGPRLDFVRTSAPEALKGLARNRTLAATCALPESRPARSALLREHLPDARVRAVPLAEGLSLVFPEARLDDPRLAALLGLLDDPAVLRRLA